MVLTEEFFTLPYGFFFCMIAPLHREEFDSFALCDTVLLSRDLEWMLGVHQDSLEWGHAR
jgi:hypothetical protein